MSYASHEGVMRSTTAPLTMTGANALASMAQVLGVSNMRYNFNPNEENPSEVMGLQRALEGKNAFVGYSLVSMMVSANPAMLQLFPVKRTNTLTHEYHYIDFPKQFAVETSPGAAPGFPTFAKSKRTATLTQYQFGATTTFQELRHSEGLTIWYGKLIVMATAFIEAAEMLVVQCLLDMPSYYAQYFIQTGKHQIDLARAGRLHDLFFDILHRRDNGMAELVDAVRSDMQNSCSIVPTDMLISEGIATLSITKLHTQYYLHGPGAATNAVKLTDAFPAVYDGIRITKVRPLDYREKRLHINLLERNVEIGQNFAIDHFQLNADLTQWTTNWMTIAFYSMETDDWAYVGLHEAIEHCGRFSLSDGRLTDHHYKLARDPRGFSKRTHVPLTKDNRIDMFIYETRVPNTQQSVFSVATVFGHMERWALTESAIERSSTTVYNYLRRAVGDDALTTIGIGIENINELYDRDLSEADRGFLREQLAKPNGRFGVPKLADDIDKAKLTRGLPAGYGTVAGLHEIAAANSPDIDPIWAAQARAFTKAAKRVYQAFVALFPCDHVALNGKYMPEGFRGSPASPQTPEYAGIVTLFQNIFDTNKLTLSKIAAGAARAAIGADFSGSIPLLATQTKFSVAVANATPQPVYEQLKTAPLTAAFAANFAQSRFARLYSEGVSGRRARGARGVASADVDAVDGAVIVSFGKFLENELKGDDMYQHGRLLAQVVGLVNNPSNLPSEITSQTLDAFRGPAGAPPQTGTSAGTPSGLAVSLGALQRSNTAEAAAVLLPVQTVLGANAIAPVGAPVALSFASPYGDGGKMSTAEATALAGTMGASANILRTAFHVQSKARGRPTEAAGVQQPQFSVSALPPLFAQTQMTDVAGGEMVINENLKQRYDAAGQEGEWLKRVTRLMLLLTPICKQTLLSMCKHNVMPPVAFLLEQPWRRYRTSTVIFLSKPSQGDIGNVLILDPDCTTGYNAISKSAIVNMTMYMGAMAMDCKNWYVAHDAAVVGYDGGETAKLFDLSQTSIVANIAMMPRDGPSILPFMVPAGSIADKNSPTKVPTSHNIRGYRSHAYYQANSADKNMEFANKPMHPSAMFYTSWLNLQQLGATPEDWKFHRNRTAHNTETHRGLSLVYDINTHQLDRVIMPQDQFKTSVYPGCRENRMSTLSNHYKEMNYESRSIGGF